MNIVIEDAVNNYSAYSPEIDGCIATGDTIIETIHNYADALEFHAVGIIMEAMDKETQS